MEDLLAEHGLSRLYERLLDEELTLDTLRWMAADTDSDFAEAMSELEMISADAELLKAALLTKPEAPPAAAVKANTATATATAAVSEGGPSATTIEVAPAVAPPVAPPAATMSSAPAKLLPPPPMPPPPAPTPLPVLIHKRVRITGLTGRPELNDKCGMARTYSAETGRYGVTIDAPIGVGMTVNVRPSNLEVVQPAAKSKYTPRRRGGSADVEDSDDDDDGPPAGAHTAAADAAAGDAAATAAAEPGPCLVPGWTPDGPRMVPANTAGYNSDVLATLAAHSKRHTPAAQHSALEPQSVQVDVLAALQAVANLSMGELISRRADGPTAPKVTSYTQINHVTDEKGGLHVSTAKNPALDAYKRRTVADPYAHVKHGKGVLHLDKGRMNPEDRPEDTRTRTQRKADDAVEHQNRTNVGQWEQL